MRSRSGGFWLGSSSSSIENNWVERPKDLNLFMGARIPVLVLVLGRWMHGTQSISIDILRIYSKCRYCATGNRHSSLLHAAGCMELLRTIETVIRYLKSRNGWEMNSSQERIKSPSRTANRTTRERLASTKTNRRATISDPTRIGISSGISSTS